MNRQGALLALVAGFCIPMSALSEARKPAEQLAKDTYQHLVSHESLLDGAIRSGDKRDFERFIEKPTREMVSRWPALGDLEFERFARCRFALDAFLIYSADQFHASGKLLKGTGSAADYYGQRRLCEKSLKIRK